MADQEQGGMILVLCPFLLQTLLQPAATPSSFFFLDISFFKYLFLAVLGWQFSLVAASGGHFLVVLCGLLLLLSTGSRVCSLQ